MKRMGKRLAAAILALVLCIGGFSSAVAEDTLSLVQHIATTQAFIDEEVSQGDLKEIVKAGLAAASAINQQPWYFVVVTNPSVMADLTGGGVSFGGAAAPTGMTMPQGAEGTGESSGMPQGAPAGDGNGASSGMPQGAPAGDGNGASFGMPQGAAGGSAKASLGDSPAAIIIYKSGTTSSPNADFDCGLACQNMVIAAVALGYGVKVVTSPTMTLNGARHDEICNTLGVDAGYSAVAVLLIGHADTDAVTSATTREDMSNKTSFIQ